MINSVLIANRGEIACRLIKTAQRLGIRTVGVYSDVDERSLAMEMADESFSIGPPSASESYLNISKLLTVAKKAKVEAIHPGYGFLSENQEFAKACENEGIIFVGPSVAALKTMGSKKEAKELARSLGIPVIPGYEGTQEELLKEAELLGYPLLIKAVMGGGGRGIRRVLSEDQLQHALESCQREALSFFGNKDVLLERIIPSPRHVEVQIFGDKHGNLVHLFERDCSLQRHHQKVIEEAPSSLPLDLKEKIYQAALTIGQAINYEGAGTVEFLVDRNKQFYFMEMNTRLQVEHPITEAITGLDLVEWQFRVASGENLPLSQKEIIPKGHALELRLYAEDPSHQFNPSTGPLWMPTIPDTVRFDTGLRSFDHMTAFYDALMAKMIITGKSRLDSFEKMGRALEDLEIFGLKTNVSFLKSLLKNEAVLNNQYDINFIDRHLKLLAPPLKIPEEIYGIASLIEVLSQPTHSTTPWGKKQNWRLEGYAPFTFEWVCEEEKRQVSLIYSPKGWRFSTYGPHEASLQNNKLFWKNHRIPFWIQETPENKRISLFYKGQMYSISSFPSFLEKISKNDKNSYVAAPLTGKVSLLFVKEGQIVQENEPLLVIEAMKMEHMIRSPRTGEIKRLFYGVGDTVEEGQELLNLGEEKEKNHGTAKKS